MEKKYLTNRWLLRRAVFCCLLGLALNSPLLAKAPQLPKELSIYYLTSSDESDVSRAAYFVKSAKVKESALFLIGGDILSGSRSTGLFNGLAEVSIFEKAGVDAVFMSEGLLLLGLKSARAVIDSARFHFLGFNIKTDSTSQPLTAGYLIKNFGSLRLALLGIIPEPFPLVRRLNGMVFEQPDYALARAIPLLRFRSDLIAVFGVKAPTANFSWTMNELENLPPHALGRIRLVAKGKSWEEKREVIKLESTQPGDSAVQAMVDDYRLKVDKIFATPVADTLFAASGLEKAVIAATGVDFVVFESGIVPAGAESTEPGVDRLIRFGHLPIFDLRGSDVTEIKGLKSRVETTGYGRSSKTKVQRELDPNKIYRVATTAGVASTETILKDKKFELSDKSLARMVLDYYGL